MVGLLVAVTLLVHPALAAAVTPMRSVYPMIVSSLLSGLFWAIQNLPVKPL